MKTYKKAAARKLLLRFDNELKSIINHDLNSFTIRNTIFARNKQAIVQPKLSVA